VEIIGLLLFPVVFVSFIWLLITAFKKSVPWGLIILLAPLLIVVLAIAIFRPSSIITILLTSVVAFTPSISFAYKNWEEAQKPFLTFIISSVFSLLISVSTLATLGDDTLEDLINQAQQGQIGEREAADRMRKIIRKMEEGNSLSEQEKLTLRTAQNIIRQVEMNLNKDPMYYSEESEEEHEQDIAEREAQRKREEKLRKLEEKLNQRVTTEKAPEPVQPRTLPTIKKSEVKDYLGSEVIVVTTRNLKHKGILKSMDEVEYSLVLEKERKTGKLIFKIHMSEVKTIFLYIEE